MSQAEQLLDSIKSVTTTNVDQKYNIGEQLLNELIDPQQQELYVFSSIHVSNVIIA